MKFLWVVLIVAFTSISGGAAFDCRSNACTVKGKKHVLCRYPTTVTDYNCGTIITRGLKDWQKQAIVDKHNALRARVAQGFEQKGNPGPQPGASNMRILSWDPELATIAQRWVDQCVFSPASCVDVERFDVGQSYVMHYDDGSEVHSNITALVDYMYSHVKNMDSNTVSQFKYNRNTYLYTNLVWADTYKVGCGHMAYRTDILKFTLYCLYGPKGNIPTMPIYHVLHD